MSNNQKKTRKKKLNDNELISNFIDKKPTDEIGEPSRKKNKLVEEVDKDDSLKFFRKIATKTERTSEPCSSKSNVASEFINKPSTSKQATTKKQKEKKSTKAKSDKKSQPDIRNVLSKQDRLFYHAINDSCSADGVDPFEMQLAMAISESLKDVNEPSTSSKAESNQIENEENPFSSTGKVKSINGLLERYGFKSKKVYSEYEIDMIMNNKPVKRSKYQKVPTVLTNTSANKRDEMIRLRIDDIVSSPLFDEVGEGYSDKNDHPIVYSTYLLEMYEIYQTVFKRSSAENMIELNDFYVTDLFEPSNAKAGHLLKDWNSIIGRDPSPQKIIKRKSEQNQKAVEALQIENEEEKSSLKNMSFNSSCSDIFDGLESFSLNQVDENPLNESETKGVNEHLDLLHEKLSQSVMCHENPKNVSQNEKIEDAKSNSKCIETVNIDLTQDSSESGDATQEYQYSLEQPNNVKMESYDLTQYQSSEGSQDKMKEALIAENNDEIDKQYGESDKNLNDTSDKFNEEADCCVKIQSDNELEVNDQPKTPPENSAKLEDDETYGSQLSNKSSYSENIVIDISDEEVNYSINRFQNDADKSPENDFQTQSGSSNDIMDIDNLVEPWLIDIAVDNEVVKIDQSVTELLTNFSVNQKSFAHQRKDRSTMFLENENINDDSIANIMKKYGVLTSPAPSKKKSFMKIQSESNLERFSQESAFQDVMNKKDDDNVDLTIINDSCSEKSTQDDEEVISSQESNCSERNNKSLANILNSSFPQQVSLPLRPKNRKSLGIVMNEKYIVDTEGVYMEPDYSNMTPHELKLQLYKYGIRHLPVKKAKELLTHIYNQMHPKIQIAADEEIDMNDSTQGMNMTDIEANIGMNDGDEFVFQLDSAGILEDEEYILPTTRKTKTSTCLLPLHISFYNMIRSNEKLQNYILEFRPLDLDDIYKHFRKFGLTYQLSDIIAFLDKRCITFKSNEGNKNRERKKERKKQKRSQKKSST